jgi:hypothetical protein
VEEEVQVPVADLDRLASDDYNTEMAEEELQDLEMEPM